MLKISRISFISYLLLLLCSIQAKSQPLKTELNTDLNSEFVALFPYEFKVELKKSNLKGPAGLNIISETILPEISAVSLPGGNLISNEKYNSVTWTDLPEDSVIKMAFRISFPEKPESNHQLAFIFYYNDNGTLAEKQLRTKMVKILPPHSVKGNRKINQTGADRYVVFIEIEKPAAGGFARLFEKLPENSMASEVESSGGAFKCEKGMIRFSWDDFLPENKTVSLSYVIVNQKEFPEITGTFSAEFLSGKYDNVSIPTIEKNVLKAEAEITQNKEIIIERDTVKSEPVIIKEVVKTEVPVIINNNVNTAASVNTSDTIYRVQFAASQPGVSESYFARKYNISEKIYVEQTGGYNKFSVGEFTDFNKAMMKRKEMNNSSFKNPFVIALVSGKRVPFNQNIVK